MAGSSILPPTLGIAFAITGLAAIVMYGLLGRRQLCADRENEIPIQEHALALGFLVLPVVTYLAAKVLAGGFNPRYLLPTVLGFPLAASYIVGALNRRLLGLFSILLLISIGVQEAAFWRVEIHSLGKKMSPAEGVERLIDAAGHDDLPVVVSDALDYLQLVHYALPPESRRLTFVADGPAAITYAGSDSADKCLLALKPYLIFQIFEFADFARSHQKFLLYSNGRPKWDWWPTRLLHDGYKIELVVMDQERRIYFVRKDP